MLKSLCLAVTLALAGPAVAQTDLPGNLKIEPALYDVVGVSASDRLNVRTGPGAKFRRVGSFAHNQINIEVVATTADGRWGMVNTDGTNGWASMRFLARAGAPADPLPDPLSCYGTEPFWSVTFTGGEAVADWSPMGLSDGPVTYPRYWSALPSNRGNTAVAIQLPRADDAIRAVGFVRMALCSDGMSDQSFGYMIDLILSGDGRQVVSGCCSVSLN